MISNPNQNLGNQENCNYTDKFESPEDIKQKENYSMFKYVVNSTKSTILIEEFLSIMYWSALIQISFLITSLAALYRNAIYFPIYIPHFAMGVMAFFIIKHLPKPHKICENMNDADVDSLHTIQTNLVRDVQSNLQTLINENSSLMGMLKVYHVMTIIMTISEFAIIIYFSVSLAINPITSLVDFVMLIQLIIMLSKIISFT